MLNVEFRDDGGVIGGLRDRVFHLLEMWELAAEICLGENSMAFDGDGLQRIIQRLRDQNVVDLILAIPKGPGRSVQKRRLQYIGEIRRLQQLRKGLAVRRVVEVTSDDNQIFRQIEALENLRNPFCLLLSFRIRISNLLKSPTSIARSSLPSIRMLYANPVWNLRNRV